MTNITMYIKETKNTEKLSDFAQVTLSVRKTRIRILVFIKAFPLEVAATFLLV